MRMSEAIRKIEAAATELQLKDRDGNPYTGAAAWGKIGCLYGKRWDDLLADFQQGRLTVEQYYERAMEMIDGHRKRMQTGRVAELFANLEDAV